MWNFVINTLYMTHIIYDGENMKKKLQLNVLLTSILLLSGCVIIGGTSGQAGRNALMQNPSVNKRQEFNKNYLKMLDCFTDTAEQPYVRAAIGAEKPTSNESHPLT